MKRILVPTDFSLQATDALKIAAQIARAHQSEIYLLHALELPVHLTTTPSGDLPEALFFLTLAKRKFEAFTDAPYLEGINTHEIVEINAPYFGINKAVKDHHIDLIVMGSSGASGLKEMFIGSNTEKVIRTAEVPVLIIKDDIADFRIDNFVFASDFSREALGAYKKAVSFAGQFNAKIHLLYVNTPEGFETTHAVRKKVGVFIDTLKPDEFTLNIYNDFVVEHGILNFSRIVHADVVGLVTHGRKGLAHFFNGSISEDIANHAMLPVVTFKIPADKP